MQLQEQEQLLLFTVESWLLLDGGTLLLVTPCHNGSGKGKSSQEGRGSNKNCRWDAKCVWHSDSCQGCSTAGKNLGLSRGQAGIQSRANTWKVVLAIRTLWPAVTLAGPAPAAALRAQLRPHQHPLTLKDLRKGESEAVLLVIISTCRHFCPEAWGFQCLLSTLAQECLSTSK